MSKLIYLDGELVPADQAKVSVFDHGLLYGDGVFEGIRAYNGRVFRLDQHIDRLYRSAHAIMLDIGMTKEEMAAAVVQTVRANELRDAYIRLVVTRGVGDLGLDPRKCPKATVFIIASTIALYPEELCREGLKIVTCATRRNSPDALDPSLKSLNYLNNILAKIETIRAGAPEGLLLNAEGVCRRRHRGQPVPGEREAAGDAAGERGRAGRHNQRLRDGTGAGGRPRGGGGAVPAGSGV